MQLIGKYIMLAGGILVLVGLTVYFLGNKVNWFGRLPGDIYVERPNFRFYAPITTMILLSILLSAIVWVIHKFFK